MRCPRALHHRLMACCLLVAGSTHVAALETLGGPVRTAGPTPVLETTSDSELMPVSGGRGPAPGEPVRIAPGPTVVGPTEPVRTEPETLLAPRPGMSVAVPEPQPLNVVGFLDWLDGGTPSPMAPPVPGAVLRVLVQAPVGPVETATAELARPGAAGEPTVPADLTASVEHRLNRWVPPGTRVLAFTLPRLAAPGPAWVRFRLGQRWSTWARLEVADPRLLAARDSVAQAAARALAGDGKAPADVSGGATLIGPYRPLPVGSRVVNGLTGETSHVVEAPGQWLFYRFDPLLGYAQPGGRWVLVDGRTGEASVTGKEDGWPRVVPPAGQGPVFDAGPSGVRQQQAFQTTSLPHTPDYGLHPVPEPVPGDEPTEGGVWQASDTPFWGIFPEGPCPNGIKKVAVIVQLSDTQVEVKTHEGKGTGVFHNAFSEKAERMKAVFKALGFDAIHHIRPGQLVSGRPPHYRTRATWRWTNKKKEQGEWRYTFHGGRYKDLLGLDTAVLERLLREIAQAGDCCTEVVVTSLSHGLKEPPESSKYGIWPAGTHFLKLEHQENERLIAEDAITTTDLVALIVEAFHGARKGCVPLSVLVNACYSGGGVANAERFLKKPPYPLDDPSVQLIASSSCSQTTKGLPKPNGTREFPFIDGLAQCIGKHGGLANRDTWSCLKAYIQARLRVACPPGKKCRQQTPQQKVVGP